MAVVGAVGMDLRASTMAARCGESFGRVFLSASISSSETPVRIVASVVFVRVAKDCRSSVYPAKRARPVMSQSMASAAGSLAARVVSDNVNCSRDGTVGTIAAVVLVFVFMV